MSRWRGGRIRRRWSIAGVAAMGVASLVMVPATSVGAATDYVPLGAPARLVDSRPGGTTDDGLYAGIGVRAAGSTLEVEVAGRAGVPADAPVVVLTVTAVDPMDVGYLTVHPTGTVRPNASNVNFYPNHNTANLVVARVGDDGKVSIFTSAATHLIVDVSGHLPTGSYVPLPAPVRLMDSRAGGATVDGQQAGIGPRPPGTIALVQVAARAGIPEDAEVVVLTVTAVDPTEVGYITVFPEWPDLPNTSNVNFYPGHNTANTVFAGVVDWHSTLFFSAWTHVIVDVAGYVPAGGYVPLPNPARLADTRPTGATVDGQHAAGGALLGGYSLQLPVAGRAGIPADASAAVLTVTAVDSTATGYVTVHPTSTPRPNASNVNYYAAHNTANTVISRIGAGGDVCVFASATTHLIVDVSGYLTGPAPPAAGPECTGTLPRFGPAVPATGGPTFGVWSDSAASSSAVMTIEWTSVETGAQTGFFRSTDATTWQEIGTIDGYRVVSIIAGGPGFVAVGREDTDDLHATPVGDLPLPYPNAWTSPDDGLGWFKATIDNGGYPYGQMDDVAVTPAGLLAVGSVRTAAGAVMPALWTSPDGTAWTLRSDMPLGSPVDENLRMRIASGSSGIVVIALEVPEEGIGEAYGWWSADGASWTSSGAIGSMWFPTDLSVHGTQFVMVGVSLVHSGTPGVWTSLDGRSWSGPAPLPVTASAAWAFDLETDGSLLLAVGDDVTYGPGPATSTGSVWMTADGESWRQLPPDGLEGSAVGEMVLHFKGAWVVLGHTDADPSIPAVWHEI